MSGAYGPDGSQSSKNSLEAMENIIKQQVAAIGQLDASLSALEKENDRLAAEQRAIKASTAKADAEALLRLVASEFRLAQAYTFLPYKRTRLCLSSVSAEMTATTPISVLGQLHHGGLLSPALSALYRAAIEHAKVTKTKLKQSFDDLTAWKFSPDSPSGKRLMTCMRQLLAKNEGLGRINEADRLASLESEAAMQATCIDEFLKTNQELESVLEESSFDLEGLQSSLLILKQQLCLAESLLDDLKREYEVHRPGQVDALIEAALADLSRLQEAVDDAEVPENEPESLGAVTGSVGGDDDNDVLVYDKEGDEEIMKPDLEECSTWKTEEDESTPSQTKTMEQTSC
uniref:Pre-mRNA-splicing regulator female-lethal(2)D n=2 Tax=Schistocephalus solidus TaxID=70667 RepID=A0A0X3P1I3_SCHSO